MDGVDRNDALIGNFSLVQKTHKWTVKVVMHFIEKAVLNSSSLYDKVNPGKLRFMQFKLDIVEKNNQQNQGSHNTTNLQCTPSWSSILRADTSDREKIKPTDEICCLFKKKVRKESRYQCKNCLNHPGLCPAPCFEKFHSC